MIGDLLPAAMGIALSPIPIIAVVVVLGTPNARKTGSLFALGWILGLAAVSVVAVLVFDAAEDEDTATSTAAVLLKLAVGALFLFLAWKQWRKRPRRGDEPEMPAWMISIESITASKALVLGAVLSGANPKNFALTLVAAASVAETGLDETGTAIVLAVFVLLGSISVAGAVLFHLFAPEKAAPQLARVRRFMLDNATVMTIVILLLLGASILGDGISALL